VGICLHPDQIGEFLQFSLAQTDEKSHDNGMGNLVSRALHAQNTKNPANFR